MKQDEKRMAECAVKLLLEKIRTGEQRWQDYLIPGFC